MGDYSSRYGCRTWAEKMGCHLIRKLSSNAYGALGGIVSLGRRTNKTWFTRPRRRTRRSLDRVEILEPRLLLTAEVEPNDTFGTGTTFSLGSDTLTGSMSSGDVDFFTASFTHGDVLVVSPGTDPGQLHFAPAVEVVDSVGNVFGRSLDGRQVRVNVPSDATLAVRIFASNAFGT